MSNNFFSSGFQDLNLHLFLTLRRIKGRNNSRACESSERIPLSNWCMIFFFFFFFSSRRVPFYMPFTQRRRKMDNNMIPNCKGSPIEMDLTKNIYRLYHIKKVQINIIKHFSKSLNIFISIIKKENQKKISPNYTTGKLDMPNTWNSPQFLSSDVKGDVSTVIYSILIRISHLFGLKSHIL